MGGMSIYQFRFALEWKNAKKNTFMAHTAPFVSTCDFGKAKTENSKKKMKKENQKQDDQIQFNLKQMHLSKIYQLLQLLLDTRIDNHPFGTRLKKPNVAFL